MADHIPGEAVASAEELRASFDFGAADFSAFHGEQPRPALALFGLRSPADLAPATQPAPTTLVFVNGTDVPCKVFWIDHAGNEVPYFVLAPGQRGRQPTFVTHPWTFRAEETADREASGKQRLVTADHKQHVVFGSAAGGESIVVIRKPAPLAWSTSAHLPRFDGSAAAAAGLPREPCFVQTARAFLLAMHRATSSSVGGAQHAQCHAPKRARLLACGEAGLAGAAAAEAAEAARAPALPTLPNDILLHILKLAAPELRDVMPLVVSGANANCIDRSVLSPVFARADC